MIELGVIRINVASSRSDTVLIAPAFSRNNRIVRAPETPSGSSSTRQAPPTCEVFGTVQLIALEPSR